ncbi:MAG: PilZ domain-containing protein [Myxococcaceae bacterium]|jgi:hypothetical protein|nr:PilZ domain-containing protein [Myxococcaceae bacterium]
MPLETSPSTPRALAVTAPLPMGGGDDDATVRPRRVRFRHPVRVTTVDGAPRAFRTLAANLSRDGLFVRMPQPLERGARVAIALEAQGRVLPFMQGEVRWCRHQQSAHEGRYQGVGIRFTEALHPRSKALVDYLVETLDTGTPLRGAPPPVRPLRRLALVAAGLITTLAAAVLVFAGAGPLRALHATEGGASPSASIEPPAPRPNQGDAEAPLDLVGARAIDSTHDIHAVHDAQGVRGVEAAQDVGAVRDVDALPGAEPVRRAEAVRDAQGVRDDELAPLTPAAERALAAAPPALSGPATGAAASSAAGVAAAPGANVEAPPPPALAEPRPTTTLTAAPPLAPRRPGPSVASAPLGRVTLPSGAARALQWRGDGNELEVRPVLRAGAYVDRVFTLEAPPRLVFDLGGHAPRASATLSLRAPGRVTRVRVGRQGPSTRVVLDLSAAPLALTPGAEGVVLHF